MGFQGNEGFLFRLLLKLEDVGFEYCVLFMERIQEFWFFKVVFVVFVVLEFFMFLCCKYNFYIEILLWDLKIMLNNWYLCLFLEIDLVFVDFGVNFMFLFGLYLI